jgi:hypothetical protein
MRISNMFAGTGIVLAAACAGRDEAVAVRLELPQTGVTLGDTTAPIVLLEIGRYGCSVCRRFTTEILPSIDSLYVRTGRAQYRYVDIGADGADGDVAVVAECAARSIGLLVAKRMAFEFGQGASSVAAVRDSVEVHLPVSAQQPFRECESVQTRRLNRTLEKTAARGLGVDETPTFVVGAYRSRGVLVGWPVVGLTSLDTLARLIEAAEGRIR